MTETAADDDCVGLDTLASARGSTDGSAGRAAGAARRRRVETNTVEWAIAVLLTLLLLRFLWSLMRNENLLPGEVTGHLLHPDVLGGVWLTVRLTVLVFALASALGLAVGRMERSGNPVLREIAAAYVWVFGGIPVLVQLLLWSNIALVFPDITFGIPGVHIDAVRLVTPVHAAIVGLALALGAYAARALSSGDRLTALGDVLVTTIQATSLVSVLAITDLLGVVQALDERNHLIIPLLVVAAIWYLLLVTAARGAIRLLRRVRSMAHTADG
ncbi:ABC transporter permease subunit [Nocardioides sp.]|uniref:ABC transporter permease subunit n=1 Tax=Nocardioides sp. TaxID=35761 RepID=UPI0019C801C2|nr:ABC transporter permease subunit [Nocardioides sp.]MBC7276336.1 ABC transporter permease subunit [Nocardioides sp.]